ncbi:MAG: dTDP-glucose 4,6-dehydratase [Burkholderia sp.]|nr:dTDP-glucose 4,6-dehydratase [Burkholderia sp.]
MILVTGGAGFIGSNFILDWLIESDEAVLNVDKLTYAGSIMTLKSIDSNPKYIFSCIDICDRKAIDLLFSEYSPRAVLNFAAESHVDRSIYYNPDDFVKTNILGTFTLLEASCAYLKTLKSVDKATFRFLQVSTDEVFGCLSVTDQPSYESSSYAPNNLYSATKAGSDHLVRAYHHTHGLPTLTTNCSNNYGPYQFPEKLIPLMITNALAGKLLPVYGDGKNIRDWIYVGDHCRAIREILKRGIPGETYNIGSWNEKENINIVYSLCDLLDIMLPKTIGSYRDQITYVADRPGHDRRYAIDSQKLENELSWKPIETFETGLKKTVYWYLNNKHWIDEALSYKDYN